MKKTLAILSAVIGAGIGAVASTTIIAAKKRKAIRFCNDSLADAICGSNKKVRDMPTYDFSDVEVIDGDEAKRDCDIDIQIGDDDYAPVSEPDLSGFTDNRGRFITPDAVTMDLPEAGRTVKLTPDGMVRCYQDGECLEEWSVGGWPDGKFIIYYYRTFGYAGNLTWLFFEEITEGDSHFRKANFKNPGYYSMTHVMVLDEKLDPLSCGYAKLADSKKGSFVLGKLDEGDEHGCYLGSNVVLHVPGFVKVGDTQGTLKDFVFTGEKTGEIYLCDIEKYSIETRALRAGFLQYEIVGWNLVADYGDCYLVCSLGEYRGSSSDHFFADAFGEHDFERFLKVCRGLKKEKEIYMWLRPVFYKEVSAPSLKPKDSDK